MNKLLIVDDEVKIRELISKYAIYEGFEVIQAESGIQAIEIITTNNDIDLIVMDIMMSDLDGFQASKEIKKIKDIPIILLSALSNEYDKIHGFDIGVDDYVVKPFSIKELIARINTIIKRYKKNEKNIIEIESLKINLDARIVTIDNNKIQLSNKEYELLVYLIKNVGIALTRENIIKNVWGYDFYKDDRTLDTHIKLLRKNLKQYSKYIVTLRGVGYRFEKTI